MEEKLTSKWVDYHKYIEEKVDKVKSVVRGLPIHEAKLIVKIVLDDVEMKYNR